ncbi:MAG: FG-GAP repeat protein [Myxococcales bacterium]|nr:MAG: FG-GAP repeat protein [Myxococcales bacterium]
MPLGACDPGVFDKLQDNTPIVDLPRPDEFQFNAYGSHLYAYRGVFQSQSVSRLAMNSGQGTGIRVNKAWDGTGFSLTKQALELCAGALDCDSNQGTSFAYLPRWQNDTMCFAAFGPELPGTRAEANILIECESNLVETMVITGPAEIGFGLSAASLPETVHDLGMALAGAPFANSNDGQLLVIPDAEAALPVTVLPAESYETLAGKLGSSVAAAEFGDGQAIVAATLPEINRIIVGVMDKNDSTLSVRACIDGNIDWTPQEVKLANINAESGSGTAQTDLIVRVDSDGNGVSDRIEVYDGSGLPDAEGCNPWLTETTLVECADAKNEDIVCASARFAAALDTGDINGDGFDDLVVGAPGSIIDGQLDAGSVIVFPAIVRATNGSLAFGEAVTVSHPSPGTGDLLGSAVAALPSGNADYARAEIVGGAPGANGGVGQVSVFLCSGLLADQSGSAGLDARCAPKAP